jgi:GT2 family glycosyltransferase
MRNNISLLVGLKNNLDYSKHFYHTTRSVYPDTEIVFVSYGSTDGTHEWLDTLKDDNVKYFYSTDQKTFADTYNKCNQLATKEFVVYAHNDMVLALGFLESLEQHLAANCAIAYTVIEPPIFAGDERPNKIIQDFGDDIRTFDLKKLYAFSATLEAEKDLLPYDDGVSFFLCIPRKLLLETGGLDPLFNPMFCEDDDLVLRFRLMGVKFYILRNALCYHFVSKTSRFSEEYQHVTKQIEENSNFNFIRKWGFNLSSPVKKKYNIGLIIKNGNAHILSQVEPYATTVYIDCDAEPYIKNTQPKTKFNLNERIKPLHADKCNDVLVSFDGRHYTNTTFDAIMHLNETITRRTHRKLNIFEKLIGKSNYQFKKQILKIEIRKLQSLEQTLIKLK